MAFCLLLIFYDQFFEQCDRGIHGGGEYTKDKYRAHDKVELKHLTAVHNQIPDTGFGNDVFPHNRPDPSHADVDL